MQYLVWSRGTKPITRLPFVLCALLLATLAAAQADEPVDLELILAVDTSGSVDDAEYVLQMRGIAWALAQPAVLELLDQPSSRGLALAVLQWSGSGEQYVAMDWQLLRGAADVKAAAARIAGLPRRFRGGDTALGSAISHAVGLFTGNGYAGWRQVIDLSGDGGAGRGQSTAAFIAQQARRIAEARSVVVNGLAILNEDPELDTFYRDNLITGAGAFVMAARDYQDFAQAMLKKLLREIGERPLAQDGGGMAPGVHGPQVSLRPGSPSDL